MSPQDSIYYLMISKALGLSAWALYSGPQPFLCHSHLLLHSWFGAHFQHITSSLLLLCVLHAP